MPEDKINQLNVNLKVMKERVKNLIENNSNEHKGITDSLNKIQNTLEEQNSATEKRVSKYYECFETKEDAKVTKKKVERQEKLYWVALTLFSIITFVLNVFGRTIVEKFFN